MDPGAEIGRASVPPERNSRSDRPETFHSILYRHVSPDAFSEQINSPEYFRDLNIDQIVAAATGRDQYNLKPFFYRRLANLDEITYRQQVMKELESPKLFEGIGAFAEKMLEIQSHLLAAEQAHYRLNKNGWLLEAVAIYCGAVKRLEADLTDAELQSRGFQDFREYLTSYVGSERFTTLAAETERIKIDRVSVKYSIVIRDLAVTVRKYQGEVDYSAEIERTFAKFRQGDVKNYLIKYSEFTGMGHVEAQIAELVAKLHPEIFSFFDRYCARHQNFLNPVLQRFDHEVQFYVSYLRHIGRLKSAGLPFCYPTVDKGTKRFTASEFSIWRSPTSSQPMVRRWCRTISTCTERRGIVVSGPNQGGKTTFARTLGQLHYLASLGLSGPGLEGAAPSLRPHPDPF